MAQSGYTPIQLYYSATPSAVPVAGNLAAGELALNTADKKLYSKDSSNNVFLLGTVTSVAVSGGTTGLTTSGGPITSSGTITLAGTLAAANGGTGLNSYSVGDLMYASGSTTISKLTIASNNYLLTSTGSAPQWSNPTSVTVGAANNLASGSAGSVPYQTGSGATSFLGIGSANYVMTSTGSAPQWTQYLSPAQGGTGVANNSANTITFSGAYGLTMTLTNTTSVTFPTSGTLASIAGAQTLTNKRIDPRVSSTSSTASLTPDIASFDQYCLTAQAVGLTINAPTGTPVDGNRLTFRILDNGGSQTITWNATYTVVGVSLPTSTTAGKTTYVGCIYNASATRWDVVAVTTQN